MGALTRAPMARTHEVLAPGYRYTPGFVPPPVGCGPGRPATRVSVPVQTLSMSVDRQLAAACTEPSCRA